MQTFTKNEQIITVLRRKGYTDRRLITTHLVMPITYTRAKQIADAIERSGDRVNVVVDIKHGALDIRVLDGALIMSK